MNSEMKSRMMGGSLGNILRVPKANAFPEVIGTFMGRDALSLAISCLDLGADDTVLLPAYLCREVLKPFLGKTRVEFYEVRSDLTIDPDEIKKRLERGKVKMMMIINYFGFLQPYRKEIRRICEDRSIILMEDCAHSLLTEGSGEIGDLSIYSFAKILPLPDGGGLKVKMRGRTFNPHFYPMAFSNVLSVLIILKSLFNIRAEIFSRAWVTGRVKKPVPNATSGKKNSRILPLSYFAYNGMGNVSFSEIIEKRRSDYQFWQESAKRTNLFTPVFSDLPSGVCPLGFPVEVKHRDLLKSRLQKEGIFLKIHWDLPEAIGREFVNSHKLSGRMLTLPIYPELGRKECEGIQRLLNSAYG
jgi:dTDP-4-amino-4,6-dideoxygalactose transaminase